MKNSSLVVFLLFIANLAFAQKKPYRIDLNTPSIIKLNNLSGEADSVGFLYELQKAKNNLFAAGYLLANVDDVVHGNDTLVAHVTLGQQYEWLALGIDNVPEEILSRSGYRKNDFNNQVFSSRKFQRLVNKILSEAANSGYPFANLQLNEIKIREPYISGVLAYNAGPVVFYDSLTLRSPLFIQPKFLENYLGVRQGKPFQISKVDKIDLAIQQLPYCKLKDSIQLGFANNLCNIGLVLEPIKANKVDAIIGFLPNQKNGGLLITGYANLQLQNLFRSGKELSFVWRQFQQQSQILDIQYDHPNLLNSPIGLGAKFSLLKQDSSFLNTNFALTGFYQKDRLKLNLSTLFKSSRPLQSPVDSLSLPEFVNSNIRQFEVGVNYSTVAGSVNPLHGYAVHTSFKIGQRNISKQPEIISSVYDSLELASIQLEVEAGGEYNHRLIGPFIFHSDATLGTIVNNDQLFTNDLLRLGGINSLRGFNDYELYVSSYALIRVEGRVVFAENSRLFIFYDQAFTDNTLISLVDQPRGFGAGLMLNTGSGDLQLVYALGVSGQQSLSLAQSKIHIGYVAHF